MAIKKQFLEHINVSNGMLLLAVVITIMQYFIDSINCYVVEMEKHWRPDLRKYIDNVCMKNQLIYYRLLPIFFFWQAVCLYTISTTWERAKYQSVLKLKFIKTQAIIASECTDTLIRHSYAKNIADHLSFSPAIEGSFLSTCSCIKKCLYLFHNILQCIILHFIFGIYNYSDLYYNNFKYFPDVISCNVNITTTDNVDVSVNTKCVLPLNYFYSVLFWFMIIWYILCVVYGIFSLFCSLYTADVKRMITKRDDNYSCKKITASPDCIYVLQKLIEYSDVSFPIEVVNAMQDYVFFNDFNSQRSSESSVSLSACKSPTSV